MWQSQGILKGNLRHHFWSMCVAQKTSLLKFPKANEQEQHVTSLCKAGRVLPKFWRRRRIKWSSRQRNLLRRASAFHAAAFLPFCTCWNTEYVVLYGVFFVGNRCLAIWACFVCLIQSMSASRFKRGEILDETLKFIQSKTIVGHLAL